MKTSPAAGSLFSTAQMAALRARSDWRGVMLVLHAWAVIAASMAMFVHWPNPLTFLLAVMLIGSRQLGLLILMHDGAHGMLARTPALNEVLAQGFCAWPTLADTHVYRRYHLRHHAHTMQPEDPDLVLTGHYPVSRASLRRKLQRDVLGQTGLAQRLAQWRAAIGPRDWPLARRLGHYWQALGPQTLANGALCAGLVATGHGYLYPLLWLLPLLTWQQAVLRVRNIAEHAALPRPEDVFGNARTTHANWLERVFIAPYWVNYHLEHHLLMWVPCHRLPLAHEFLQANGYGERLTTSPGYWRVLAEVTLPGDNDAPRPPRGRASGTFGEGFSTTGEAWQAGEKLLRLPSAVLI